MRTNSRWSSGFSLLEMLIVVAILGLIAALVARNVGGQGAKAKVELAHVGVEKVAGYIEQFQLDVGRYPTVQEGLIVLVEKPQQEADGWDGPYTGKTSLPKDPWNNEYVYEWVKKPNSEDSWYVIKSLGADGKLGGEGTAADIDNRT